MGKRIGWEIISLLKYSYLNKYDNTIDAGAFGDILGLNTGTAAAIDVDGSDRNTITVVSFGDVAGELGAVGIVLTDSRWNTIDPLFGDITSDLDAAIGVNLDKSSHNDLTGLGFGNITSTQNLTYGVLLDTSEWNNVTFADDMGDLRGRDKNVTAISLYDADHNSVSALDIGNITLNSLVEYPVVMGIDIIRSDHNTIAATSIGTISSLANGTAIGIDMEHADWNTITVTTIGDISCNQNGSAVGITLWQSHNNTIDPILGAITSQDESAGGISVQGSNDNVITAGGFPSITSENDFALGIEIQGGDRNTIIITTDIGDITGFEWFIVGVQVLDSTGNTIVTQDIGDISASGPHGLVFGFYLDSANGNSLTTGTIGDISGSVDSLAVGIWVTESSGNEITCDRIGDITGSFGAVGIIVESSDHNVIDPVMGNITSESDLAVGIYLYSSTNNSILDTGFGDVTSTEAWAMGLVLDQADQTTITFSEDCGAISAPNAFAQAVNMTNSHNCTITGAAFGDISGRLTTYGLNLTDSHDNEISLGDIGNVNSTEEFTYGILLTDSHRNTITTGSVAGVWGNSTVRGIHIDGSDGNTLTTGAFGNIHSDTSAYGLWLLSSDQNTVTVFPGFGNVTSSGVVMGIYVVASHFNTIDPIFGNITATGSSPAYGIRISISNNNTISGAGFGKVRGRWAYGILCYDSDDNAITADGGFGNITASTNEAYGIYLDLSDRNVIDPVFVRIRSNMNSAYGVYFDNSSSNVVTGLEFTNINGRGDSYGFFIQSSPMNSFTMSSIASGGVTSRNGDAYGVSCVSSRNVTLTGVGFQFIDGNSNALGASIETSSGVILSELSILGTTGTGLVHGVHLWNSNYALLQGCLIRNVSGGSPNEGITLENSYYVTILNSTVTNCSGDGIHLYWSSHNTLSGNTVYNNRVNGIVLGCIAANAYNTVIDNRVFGNDNFGIYLKNNEYSNDILNNTVYGNHEGIVLFGVHDNTVTGNTLSDHTGYDLNVTDSPDNMFQYNTFSSLPTTASFTYSGDFAVSGVDKIPPPPTGYLPIGKALDIVNLSEGTWVNVTIFYEDSDIPVIMDELLLEIWKHNGTWYQSGWESWKGLEMIGNEVSANITEFGSLFVPLAGESVPPTTAKEIGTPSQGSGTWLTTSTPIWLNATDEPYPNQSGVNVTYYRVWENGIWHPSGPGDIYGGNSDIWFNGTAYWYIAFLNGSIDNTPISFTETCTHHITFYSVDLIGNKEIFTNQTHYVDDTPPEIIVSIGSPNYPGTLPTFDRWVTTDTPITFSSEDEGCNDGVGMELFACEIYWYNETTSAWELMDSWTLDTDPFEEIVHLQSEGKNRIDLTVTDLLGNTDTLTLHIYVDNSPPETTLEFGGPYYTDGSQEWITSSTPVYLNATDNPTLNVGVAGNYYRIGRSPATLVESVVIIVNENSPGSVEIGEYYAAQRNIPLSHICYVDAPTTEIIERDEYLDLEAQVRAFLESNDLEETTLFLVTTKGVPLKVNGTNAIEPFFDFNGNCSSVDSELALLFSPYASGNDGQYENPYANATEVFQSITFDGIYLVNRLTGRTVADAKALVDRALAAEQLAADLSGYAYLDADPAMGGGFDYYDQLIIDSFDLLTGMGYESGLENTTADIGNPGAIYTPDSSSALPQADQTALMALLYWGWYTHPDAYQDTFEWQIGAMGQKLHSYNALTFEDNSWCAGAVADGITGTQGNVYEPYLAGSHLPDVFFDRILAGYTFAEASYMAQPYLSWQSVVIGDPLYTPFFTTVDDPFTMDEECGHTISFFSTDLLGNQETTDLRNISIDDTPPTTTLDFGTPYYDDGSHEWITSNTLITLTAVDGPDCACGVAEIWYDYGDGWTLYTGPFVIPEECEHTIQYYAVDNLGNTETEETVIVRVDNSAPDTVLEFGDPQGITSDLRHWVHPDTPLFLNSTDLGCEGGVGDWTMFFRIRSQGTWTEWYESDINTNLTTTMIELGLDSHCMHLIEWYAVDALGNTEVTNSHTYYLPPVPTLVSPPDGWYYRIGHTITMEHTEESGVPIIDVHYFYDLGQGAGPVEILDSDAGTPGVQWDTYGFTKAEAAKVWVELTDDRELTCASPINTITFCQEENPDPCVIVMNLGQGWNLISIGVMLDDLGGDYTASELAFAINAQAGEDVIKYVVRYNPLNGLFEEYVVTTDIGLNFPIEFGQAYYVYSTSPFDAEFAIVGDCPENETFDLVECWNLIGWVSMSTMDVGEFADHVDAFGDGLIVQAVVRFDHDQDPADYEAWYRGEPGDAFQVRPGEAYWVFSATDVAGIPYP
jgi:uncharacterized protein (TIGR03790 family)